MSSTQLIEQCATRLRGIVEALDNIHDNTPHRWSTDLDEVHSSAESLLAMIKDQAPARSETSFEEWLANELEGEDGQPVPAAVCDIALARRAFNHWPKLEQPAKVGGVRFSAGVSSRLVVEAAQRLYEFESTPEKEAEQPSPEQACFTLNPDDLYVDTYSTGRRGSWDARLETAVRVMHKPTGITATSASERSQHANAAKAKAEVARLVAALVQSSPAQAEKAEAERAACERWITDQKLCQGSDISLFRLERNGELVSLHALLCEAYQAGQVRAALAHAPTSSASPSCKWTESSGIWETGCGQTWNFIEDGPAENGALFCHHCGGRLVLIKSDDQEDDGEPCPECLEHGCNGECAGHGAMGD
ncbi:peptide chain release factor-like protein [Pseudomonas aeruginosa]|uniref:peptide chain release factor-like protein n=1 Tax=Pseudomonas aeruginosa TaxID=287 RepID=UPI0029C09096|nr:peptide chain release factor-like protein [Pseudomonas aeruginosa]HBO5236088.1 hypothetical protein [Pseudomonas aeruginosa]